VSQNGKIDPSNDLMRGDCSDMAIDGKEFGTNIEE
jgi:hypothetical protein